MMNKEKELLGFMSICWMQVEKGSPWEIGMSLSEGQHGYLDRFGNHYENIWQWQDGHKFSVDMRPILEEGQQEVVRWEEQRARQLEESRAFQERLKQEKAGKRPRLSKVSDTCIIEGCDNEAKAAKGLCHKHYQRQRRHGNTDDPDYINSGKQCSVEGCEDDAHNKGLCLVHYQRFSKYGDVHHVENLRGQMDPVCRIDGCDESTIAHNLCNKHLTNFRYHRGVSAKDANEYIEKKNRGEI